MIEKSGIYDLSREEYDADPAPSPSLNASVAKILLEKSARHAWLAHPRLNPKLERDRDKKFDLGTAAHAVMFSNGSIYVVEADDYRTKAAQVARDTAIENGKLPVLLHQMDTVYAMVGAARRQIEQSEDAQSLLLGGKPEQTMLWQEGETWCRARVDWMPHEGNIILDYKTTAASANPEHWGARTMYDTHCDVQAVFYLHGLEKVTGRTWEFRFIVQETEPPYALSVVGLGPSALALGEAKVQEALRRWRWCTERGYWPGYPRETWYVTPPPWVEARFRDGESRRELGQDDLALGMKVYAPDETATKETADV